MQNKSGIKIPQRKIKININRFFTKYLHFAKRQNDGKNRPSGQFFPSSPRYAGDEKPSLLSHDVLPSPALLDFLREQALSKTPQSGGSLCDTFELHETQRNRIKKKIQKKYHN
ncbi:hypothetical protein NTJ28_002469 [Flavobacterium psychrophilum]|nr:hypothetical protein [Flavobacterium psychrophilum]EKT4510548.1 hypothetical protein [Flavobacterium psychrophilum]